MIFPNLHGLEFFLIPLVSCFYLFTMTDFTWPGALLNNAIITGATAGAAMWRSRSLAQWAEKRRDRQERMTPIGPFLTALVLAFLAALQLIGAVTHLSYYRKGALISEPMAGMFDR